MPFPLARGVSTMEAWRTTKARNRWPPRAGGGGRHVACGSPLTRR